MVEQADRPLAVVTGGAGGIGRATAQLLAERGAITVLMDLHEGALKGAAARMPDSEFQVVDVTDAQAVQQVIDDVIARHGKIDILINSAGITGPAYPVQDYPLAQWNQMLAVHLTGTFHTMRSVIPHMVERGRGKIVNVASVAGKEGNPNSSAYSAAKAGVIALTKSAGKELATSGVFVNCVTPGIIETPMLADATPEHTARLIAKIPMGRAGQPLEVALAVAWLTSEECTFTTASVLDLSGGRATY